jgi:histidine ammonia-lyase
MKDKKLSIDKHDFTWEYIQTFLNRKCAVELHADSIKRIEASRAVIKKIIDSGKAVYGVNTGFGKFADVRIRKEETEELQRRLTLSHAAGVGAPTPVEIVRLMMLLKIKNLSLGHSGVRLETVQLLAEMLNHQITPVVPEKGSVGASGDLAPLAHIALVMIGEGEAFVTEKDGNLARVAGAEALQRAGLKPVVLAAKEGLAILNGTQAMQAYGIMALHRSMNLLKTADIIGAMSLEALLGTLTAFDPRIQQVRRQPGQMLVAENIRKILQESAIVESHRFSEHKVQDAYCLRCIPQVHGAVRDAVSHITQVFAREMNGVSDNPLVFPETGEVLSGGNFHGEPLAMAADYLAIAMAELASIAERRIEHLLDPAVSEMAGFLTEEGGLNSGFMIAHVTAAALVSENKTLAHPASVDSIPTSANKEDHVSMGLFAGRKALEIIQNAETVLAIELLCACQALDLRAPVMPSPVTERVLDTVREQVAHWKEDRYMHPEIVKAQNMIHDGVIVRAAEAVAGKLV